MHIGAQDNRKIRNEETEIEEKGNKKNIIIYQQKSVSFRFST